MTLRLNELAPAEGAKREHRRLVPWYRFWRW